MFSFPAFPTSIFYFSCNCSAVRLLLQRFNSVELNSYGHRCLNAIIIRSWTHDFNIQRRHLESTYATDWPRRKCRSLRVSRPESAHESSSRLVGGGHVMAYLANATLLLHGHFFSGLQRPLNVLCEAGQKFEFLKCQSWCLLKRCAFAFWGL